MSSLEREKVFLEVHIQNMTQDAMWFERMEFDCAEGWNVADANTLPSADDSDGHRLFSGSMALMQPQAVRQYIYILTPTSSSSFPVIHPSGSVIPLGRLDISWRSQFGEPGRLLTSVRSVLNSGFKLSLLTYRRYPVEFLQLQLHLYPQLRHPYLNILSRPFLLIFSATFQALHLHPPDHVLHNFPLLVLALQPHLCTDQDRLFAHAQCLVRRVRNHLAPDLYLTCL